METIRIISYNIHSGAGMDGVVDHTRIANVLRNSGAHLCGLQEISIGRADTDVDDPVKHMGNILGQQGYFAETIKPTVMGRTYRYGIGAFSGLKSELIDELELPNIEGAEPRKVMFLKNELDNGKSFFFANTHLACGRGEEMDQLRLLQIQTIHEYIRKKKYYHIILTGDLNAVPGSPCVVYLQQNFILEDAMSYTFPADEPKMKIDYIASFHGGAFKVLSHKTLDEKVASDHRPLCVEYAIRF